MTKRGDDERGEGIVMLFPENFPSWALTPEERRNRLRLVDDDALPQGDEPDERP